MNRRDTYKVIDYLEEKISLQENKDLISACIKLQAYLEQFVK